MSDNQNTKLAIFNFDGFDVRIEDRNGDPWFVAKDVCQVLGIQNHKDAIKSLDEDEKSGVDITDPHGRSQRTLIISESGLYHLVGKSRKPEAKEFQKWIRKEVIPSIRKTGAYSVKPLSQLEILKQSLEILVAQQKKLDEHDNKFEEIDDKLEKIVVKQSRDSDFVDRLKDSIDPAKEMSPRAKLNLIIRKYVQKNDASYSNCWNDLYVEFKYRYSIDVKRRAVNSGKHKLDIVDELNMMDELYSVAVELFLN